MKPSHSILIQLGLNPGNNELVYKFKYSSTAVSELKICIYLYSKSTKFIISDIDGTITKSDFLGYILPAFGIDYHFSGVVDLYTNLKKRGYEIVYLTARSIGEYGLTKRYLKRVKENKLIIPDGPLLMYPKNFMGQLKNDLITKKSDVKLMG